MMPLSAADTVLSGSRIVLRPFREGDIGDAYLSWLNDPEVTRYSNQRFARHDQESARAYLASFADGPNHFLLVEERAGGRPIGTLTAYVAPRHLTADMGIMIGDRACWGRGYGHEAWSLLMDWLFATGTRKVTAGTSSLNIGMQRIAERSGMVLEGRRIGQELFDGEAADILLYGRFRP